MFWGLLLKTHKRYTQVVQKDFHISHATLDLTSSELGDEVVQVWVSADEVNHLLCNLDKRTSQVQLDLAFSEGETIAFFSKGAGIVHLTGFLMPEEPDYGMDGLGEEEEEEGDEELSDEEQNEVSKKSRKQNTKSLAKQLAAGDEDDEDSDLDEAELLSGDDDDEDDEEDDDEEDDEAEEEDAEEEIQTPPAKIAKIDKAAKQNGLANGKATKLEKKLKNQKEHKKDKQQPQPIAIQPQQNANQPQQKPKSAQKILQSGVIIEDLRPGKGPEAKSGKKVQVYYEGRLKSNNKVFDSSKAGDGFKFNLGRGEVIRGWDIGVAGMKVGGKRRIICPANAGYGPKGSPPTIPGNATLVFDVELRGVN